MTKLPKEMRGLILSALKIAEDQALTATKKDFANLRVWLKTRDLAFGPKEESI